MLAMESVALDILLPHADVTLFPCGVVFQAEWMENPSLFSSMERKHPSWASFCPSRLLRTLTTISLIKNTKESKGQEGVGRR